jgi:hypothetical protein
MEALNIEAEYRKFLAYIPIPEAQNAQEFADAQVRSGKWVEDDGDYYTREVWEVEEERVAEELERQALKEQEEYERQEWAREQQAEYDDFWHPYGR